MATQMGFHEIADVLGTSKPVVNYYGDGSFDCPHCSYPVTAADGLDLAKHNPWCLAHPAYPVDKAREVIVERECKAREDADRQSSLARSRQDREERQAREMRQIADARTSGVCVACFVRSGLRKEVKHRKACPNGATA